MRFDANIQSRLSVFAGPLPDRPEHILMDLPEKVVGEPLSPLFFSSCAKHMFIIGSTDGFGLRRVAGGRCR